MLIPRSNDVQIRQTCDTNLHADLVSSICQKSNYEKQYEIAKYTQTW